MEKESNQKSLDFRVEGLGSRGVRRSGQAAATSVSMDQVKGHFMGL